jgi:hypothetical protein
VTPEEEERIRERAAEVGLTKSEWCRQAILRSLETGAETRLLLAELLAIRKVFLALHVDVLQGQSLSEPRIRQVVEQAESTKFAMADNRIQAFRSHQSNE